MKNPKDKPLDPLKVQLWIHQSGLLWSRLQTISAIQVGALAGWWFLRDKELWLSNGLLVAAVALIGLVWGLMERDIKYMDAFGATIRQEVPEASLSGRGIGRVLLGVLILVNLILLASSCRCRDKQETPKTPMTPSSHQEASGLYSPP